MDEILLNSLRKQNSKLKGAAAWLIMLAPRLRTIKIENEGAAQLATSVKLSYKRHSPLCVPSWEETMKKLFIAIVLSVTGAQAGEANDAWEAMFRAAGGGGDYCAQTGQCTNPQKWDRVTKEQCLDLWANPKNLSCNGPCTAADLHRRDVANGGIALADKCDAYRVDTRKDFDTALTKEREWNNAHYVTSGEYCQRVRSLMTTRVTADPVVVCDARNENQVGGVARGNYRGGGPNALWYFTGSWDGELMTTPCGEYEKNEASPCYRARQVVSGQ